MSIFKSIPISYELNIVAVRYLISKFLFEMLMFNVQCSCFLFPVSCLLFHVCVAWKWTWTWTWAWTGLGIGICGHTDTEADISTDIDLNTDMNPDIRHRNGNRHVYSSLDQEQLFNDLDVGYWISVKSLIRYHAQSDMIHHGYRTVCPPMEILNLNSISGRGQGGTVSKKKLFFGKIQWRGKCANGGKRGNNGKLLEG